MVENGGVFKQGPRPYGVSTPIVQVSPFGPQGNDVEYFMAGGRVQ